MCNLFLLFFIPPLHPLPPPHPHPMFSFQVYSPHVVVKTARSDSLTFLATLAEGGHFFTNSLCESLGSESHWPVLGRVCICEPVTMMQGVECFDWPGIGHVPAPGTGSRISWTEGKREGWFLRKSEVLLWKKRNRCNKATDVLCNRGI